MLVLCGLSIGLAASAGTPGHGSDDAGPSATEAPTGFGSEGNGLVDDATHQSDQASFDEVEGITDGLGPTYNAQSCRECHQSPVSGGTSQVRELRAGHLDGEGNFVGATVTLNHGTAVIANRSLINLRAICPASDPGQMVNGVPFNFPDTDVAERVSARDNIRTLRTSLNTLGDGFVESVPDETLRELAEGECQATHGTICGEAIEVPVLELGGAMGVGRFGWKDQHASLLSFSGDAYVNEMGITNRLFPTDVTSLCDIVPDPENVAGPDGLADIDRFARFIRATKAPARDLVLAATPDAQAGAMIFQQIGCAMCHTPTLVTAPAGTEVAGGAFVVPDALGSKRFHPFSDFLLHDVGTGDGIVQAGGQETASKLRTPPLWGVRLRTELMHDGLSQTFADAITRHRGEASEVVAHYYYLSPDDRRRLIAFLNSL